jgi:hypothetical protein
MAELVTAACVVTLSRLVQPVVLRAHRFYWLETDAGGFVSVSPPVVLDQNGAPIRLITELPPDSTVRVHTVDGYLRTVQVLSIKQVNPFA